MYFRSFPVTYYTNDDKSTVQILQNLLLRNVVDQEIKDNFSLFDEYDVKDGDTPEILAFNLYGDSNLHWLILHYNEILDPRFDWCFNEFDLNRFVAGKYTDPDAIHHYEDANKNIVDSDEVGATPISNYTYESRLNEERRRIRLLKPAYVEEIVTEFKSKLEL